MYFRHRMKKHFCLAALSLFVCTVSFAQKQWMVAFYNQENLFDTIDDPERNDNEFLPKAKNEWNTEKYQNKLSNMAKVIASMNQGKGPDILGLCEVENKTVLQDLVKQPAVAKAKYAFVHFESPDERSIDNALLYQPKKFDLDTAYPIAITFPENPRSKTRDILLVKLTERKSKQHLIVLVNHFPSRLGGQNESEPKRIRAAAILRQVYDSISRVDANAGIVLMGDFNDEPTNTSMANTLQGRPTEENTIGTDLFNAMFKLKSQGIGSHYYKGEWSALDQILISNNLLHCRLRVCYKESSASVYKQDWMLETNEKFKGAPLRTFAGKKYLNGFSDHLPVYIMLTPARK
jgi:predicted extracellular nuclease